MTGITSIFALPLSIAAAILAGLFVGVFTSELSGGSINLFVEIAVCASMLAASLTTMWLVLTKSG